MSINYHLLIEQLLIEQVSTLKQSSNLDWSVIIDAEHDHFILLKTGWQNITRVCLPHLYIRLENGKVWIEQDETHAGFALKLQAVGVPSQDIVLGFHQPHIRKLTPYAVD
ncbi:MAG: element excision factor XisI family protein [Candidatus Promineifilaceae bacterium]